MPFVSPDPTLKIISGVLDELGIKHRLRETMIVLYIELLARDCYESGRQIEALTHAIRISYGKVSIYMFMTTQGHISRQEMNTPMHEVDLTKPGWLKELRALFVSIDPAKTDPRIKRKA